ncbi:MAG: biopolymer transporter ExbD [Candidatus Melainabacteria bacterium]|nr:biopolymer transporter ExbD [Candidatus Melainabacteria bacterium]
MSMGGKAGEVFTEINVTPLTDVFLVLLVIMILIAPLVNQAVLKVSPPGISTAQTPPKDDKPKVEANVTADGRISINGAPIDPPDTKAIMDAIKAEQAKNPEAELPLILASDEDALQKHVVSVMDAAAGCDIKNMIILPPRPSGK